MPIELETLDVRVRIHGFLAETLVDYFGGSGPELLGPVTVQTLIVTRFGTDGEQVELQSVRLDTVEDTVEIGTVVLGDWGAGRRRWGAACVREIEQIAECYTSSLQFDRKREASG